MRPKALGVMMVALTLGGCLGPGVPPTVTGSLRPPLGAGDPANRPSRADRALADAVRACLDLGSPVKMPAFRRCVADRQATAPVSALR